MRKLGNMQVTIFVRDVDRNFRNEFPRSSPQDKRQLLFEIQFPCFPVQESRSFCGIDMIFFRVYRRVMKMQTHENWGLCECIKRD